MSKLMISLIILMFAFMKSNNDLESRGSAELLPRIDHLVFATPDLNRGIDEIEKLLGVRASPGGRHPGRGTRNALLALGPASYLEIIGPDPDQAPPKTPPPFGIDSLRESRLVSWVAKSNDLEKLRQEAVRNGIQLGEVISGSRQRPDGVLLSWRYTNPQTVVADGIVPFFIDWGESPHPSRTAAGGLSLIGLSAEHPDAERAQKMLSQLGLDLTVKRGSKPALIAVITGPKGRVELR
ncbi:MAG: VOC family protein [Acidobacteria bacterium]|nr:VOC family protein [Acidobacteriota bacterium]